MKPIEQVNPNFIPLPRWTEQVTGRRNGKFFNFNNSLETISYDSSDFDFDDFVETTAFVEVKKIRNRSEVNGIDIRGTEPFRQGVEIRDKHSFFLNSNYKIHSGKKGHRISRENYGFEDSDIDFLVSHPTAFVESEIWSTLGCIQLHQPEIDLLCVDANDQSQYDHGQLKNVIEPLSIRPVASLMSPYFPFEPNSFWGHVCDGNLQPNRSVDSVVTVIKNVSQHITPFYEQEEIRGPGTNKPTQYFEAAGEMSHTAPFNDNDQSKKMYEKVTGDITKVTDKIIYGVDDYLGYDENSCSTGFTYDNSVRGIDSIAFGGQTYL